MKVRIKYMYEQGDTKALEDLFTSNSIADFLNQADYIETVHNYDREKLQEYVETTKKIENLKKTLEEDLANLEEMQTSFESQKEQLSQTLAEKQAEVENLDQELQAAIAQAAAEEEARRKAEEEARRKAQEEAAAAAGGKLFQFQYDFQPVRFIGKPEQQYILWLILGEYDIQQWKF